MPMTTTLEKLAHRMARLSFGEPMSPVEATLVECIGLLAKELIAAHKRIERLEQREELRSGDPP